MSATPEDQRAELLAGWERSAKGWGERADLVREFGMPVSVWMLDALALQPGMTVLELAAGPGDTGFLAAELIEPGGKLICSDGAEAMLEVARKRAAELGIGNVEFKQLELEWIDLPAASVDAALCRWGVMLIVDPAAALREARRVLKPGGRYALAVWDTPDQNPWATIPGNALISLGLMPPADPNAPGMFALAAPGRLAEMLADAGFVEVTVDAVDLGRPYESFERFMGITCDIARPFRDAMDSLSDEQRAEVISTIASLAEPFTQSDGSIEFPSRSLVAVASA
jgi:SAM-dependent methyltransferase